MGMWTRHRQRQAGRYARASYQLAVREANRTAAMRRVELLAIARNGAARSSGISWTSDLDGNLGQGARIAPALRPGRHRIDVRSDEPFVKPAWLDVEID